MYWSLFEADKHVGVFALGSCWNHPKPVKDYMESHSLDFNEVGLNFIYCLYGNDNRNAGSQFLALCRKDARVWWRERYGDELKAFQTFILPPRTGAIYKADNWELIGRTKGMSWTTETLSGGADRLEHLRKTTKQTEPKLVFMRLWCSEAQRITIPKTVDQSYPTAQV